jgi:hypothetical protein
MCCEQRAWLPPLLLQQSMSADVFLTHSTTILDTQHTKHHATVKLQIPACHDDGGKVLMMVGVGLS